LIPDFKWELQTNKIKDCPVTVTDAEIALMIWEPNIATLKGKSTCKAANAVKIESFIPILKDLLAMT
jgi:hypothetical protein